jgi:hypothetical protein
LLEFGWGILAAEEAANPSNKAAVHDPTMMMIQW